MKYRNINIARVFYTLLFAVLVAGLAGCAGAKKSETSTDDGQETLAAAEARFNPSDYNRDPAKIADEDEHGPRHAAVETVAPRATLDTVQGFRVQVLFTQDIEQAGQLRDALNAQLPGQYVYVVYDAPYYKVRVGNFAEKPEANDLLRSLVKQGYSDAWVVRDNVVLHLPPRPQTSPTELPVEAPADSTEKH